MCFLTSMTIHNMVVQELISWKTLTCQCLTWNVECLGLETHVHHIHLVFIKWHMLLLHWFSSSSLGNPYLLRTA